MPDPDPKTWKIVPYNGQWGIEREDGRVLPCQTKELAEQALKAMTCGRWQALFDDGMWYPKK